MCAPDSNFDVKTSHSLSMEVCGESSPPELNASGKKNTYVKSAAK